MKEYSVQIQTVSACSGKCVFCPYLDSWHKHNPGVMSDEVFNRIVEQLEPLKLKKLIPYLENEPLLDRKIYDRIETLKERLDFKTLEVSTNADSLDENTAQRLAELMSDVPHELWVSFHGVDKRTHEGIMGLDFDKCLANVITLLKLSDTMPLRVIIRGAGEDISGTLKHGFEFSEAEYIDFWEGQVKKHGIKTRPGINWIPFHDRAGTILRNGIRLEEPVRPDLTGFHCPRVDQWLHFLYTGELILCCMDYHREAVFGDIREQTLDEILNGETYLNLRDQVTGRAASAKNFICKRCISPGG